jgi:hypothetical protein
MVCGTFRGFFTLVVLATLAGPATAQQPPDPQGDREDEHLFRSTLPIEGKTVLDFFRKLTLTPAEKQRIEALIAKLDVQSFKERDLATTQLLAEGTKALPLLQQALPGATLERSKRLERCLKVMARPDWVDVVGASARLLVRYRPPEAAATLLAYLPFSPEEAMPDVLGALDGVSSRQGKLDPVVTAALSAGHPTQRAAAAVIVGFRGNGEQQQVVFPLLNDPHPVVRFRAAQGLLAARHKAALPVLIALLKKGPADLAEQAEGILAEVAGPWAPSARWADDKEHREKCHAAWWTWWIKHQERLSLEKLAPEDVLTFGGDLRQAKTVGIKFWKAMAEGDTTTIRKIIDFPLQLGNHQKYERWEEVEKVFERGRGDGANYLQMLKFGRVVRAKVFAEVAAAWGKEYLDKLEGGRIYAVCWTLSTEGQNMGELALIVRVRGGKARVIGGVESATLR